MTIKQIVVHPKGATHTQVLCDTHYWMRKVEDFWYFFSEVCNKWLPAETGKQVVKPIHQIQ